MQIQKTILTLTESLPIAQNIIIVTGVCGLW